MEIKSVRTRAGYRAALKEIEALMSARAGTPEGKRLDVLVTLVEAYEKKHSIALALDRFEATWNKAAARSKNSRRETGHLTRSRANVRRLRAAHSEIGAEIARRKREAA